MAKAKHQEELEQLKQNFTRRKTKSITVYKRKAVDHLFTNMCVVRRVVDGDTVDVDIDLGHDVWIRNKRIRLVGIDTPESRTRDAAEKKHGQMAAGAVIDYFDVAEEQNLPLILQTSKKGTGKFGRILADFYSAGSAVSLCRHLLDHQLAVDYNAENKALVEEQHIKNRNFISANNYLSAYTQYCFALYHSRK